MRCLSKKTMYFGKWLPCDVLRGHYVPRFTFHVLGLLLISILSPAISEEANSPLPDDSQVAYLIRQITLQGNERLDRKALSRVFGVHAGQPYHREEVITGLTRIIGEYRKAGFVFASIAPEIVKISSDQVHIRIQIDEGSQIRAGQITISGNQLFSTPHLRRELGLREGAPFSQVALESGIQRILTLYSEHGHPKVEIEPTDLQLFPEHGKIVFHLKVSEGVGIRIGEIKLSGLKKTREEVVLRELPIQAGEVFDQRKINQSFRHLTNLGYFYEVNPVVLEEGQTPDAVIFHARVTEARTGRFSGVIGYAPPTSEFEAAPELTGVIEAYENNLLGTGRRASFFWKSGLLKTLRLGAEEPWAFGKPVSVGVEYAQVKQRNQFTDTESEEQSGSLKISTRLRSTFEGGIAISYKRIDFPAIGSPFLLPTDSADLSSSSNQSQRNASLDGQAQNGVKYGVTFSLTRDSRDYFLNPTQGRRDRVAFEFSRGDFRLRKLWVDLQQYLPTWRKQVIAIGLHGAATWGDNIPPTELFYLGGANTLRGYDEDWFSGPRRVYTNLEYRLLVGRTSQIFAFVDLGAVTQIDRPSVFDPLRVGYGFGMRLESKGGLLRMDYGLAEGGSALKGKIHVNLGTSF